MSNAFSRVASAYPTNTSEAELYAVPSSTEFQGDIHMFNQSASDVAVSVALLDSTGSAGNAEWLLKEYVLVPKTPQQITGLCLAALATINIQVGTGSTVSFNLYGVEITS